MENKTSQTTESGVIDITKTVESMRQSFVTWAVAYVFGLEVAIPGMEWVALPGIELIDRAIIKAIIDMLSKSLLMQAFFINTAIRKASQAQDYITAIEAKNNLPPTASEVEYENAEKSEMSAFRDFVSVTR